VRTTSRISVVLTRALALAIVIALSNASCTSLRQQSLPTPPAVPPSPWARTFHTCFIAPPPRWGELLNRHAVALPPELSFAPGAIEGGTVAYGQFRSPSGEGIARLDLLSGHLTPIAPYPPGTSGLGWMVAEAPWLVWEEGDSTTDLGSWSLHAWDQLTGHQTLLAQSGGENEPHGPPPFPTLRGTTVAWAQPVEGRGPLPRAQVHLFDLARGHDRVLATGTVSSPVFAGPYLIWARLDGQGRTILQAVEASSLRSVTLPGDLAHPGSVGYLAGSSRYLAWSSSDLAQLTVWKVGSDHYATYTSDLRHPFQFLQLAGHFVLWFGGTTSSILDLETGAAFDVPGTIAGSQQTIVTSNPVSGAGARVSAIPLAELGPEPSCGS
jgi:hypothetical protein